MPPFRLALIIAVACSYAMLLSALLGSAPPAWSVAVMLGALLVAVHAGIFFLNLSVFVDVFARRPRGARAVALTFDDGPHPVHTRRVLDTLDARGVKGTFFLIGAKAEAHPDVVQDIVRRGHEVALHSFVHDHILFCRAEPAIVKDIERTQDVIERAAGVRPKLFRPPVGFSSPRTRTAVRALDLTVVGWSARAFDGAGRPSADRILKRLLPALDDGAVVLLHDAPERGDEAPTSVEALPRILDALEARGLHGVTVSTLIAGAAPEPSPEAVSLRKA